MINITATNAMFGTTNDDSIPKLYSIKSVFSCLLTKNSRWLIPLNYESRFLPKEVELVIPYFME